MFEENLKKIKDKVLLSEEKKAEIRKNLLGYINAEESLRTDGPSRHILQRSVSWLTNHQLKFNFMPIFAVLLAAVLLGGGTSLAAQNSLPGDLLYPVKVNVNEKVESALALNTNAKADLQVKLAETRLVEAEKLSQEGKMSDEAKAELNSNFKAHADAADNLIAELKDKGDAEDAAEAASGLEVDIRSHAHILDLLQASSSVNISGELKDAEDLRNQAESEIEAHGNGEAKTQAAAEARINAAAKAIADVQSIFNSDKASLSASTTVSIQDNLDSANKAEADARTQFAAKNYGQAFVLANQAFRIAEETRALFSGEDEFNLSDEHKNEQETPEASESPEPSGSHSDESDTNVSGSSSAGAHGDNGEVNVNGNLNLHGE